MKTLSDETFVIVTNNPRRCRSNVKKLWRQKIFSFPFFFFGLIELFSHFFPPWSWIKLDRKWRRKLFLFMSWKPQLKGGKKSFSNSLPSNVDSGYKKVHKTFTSFQINKREKRVKNCLLKAIDVQWRKLIRLFSTLFHKKKNHIIMKKRVWVNVKLFNVIINFPFFLHHITHTHTAIWNFYSVKLQSPHSKVFSFIYFQSNIAWFAKRNLKKWSYKIWSRNIDSA